ncbi:MAG: lipid-binding SYLF domain-containing protein [Hyphomonadaceae bacterium]
MTLFKFGMAALFISLCAACASSTGPVAFSGDVQVLETESQEALAGFLEDHPDAVALSEEAYATLVFPGVVKGGFIYGAHYGRGALLQDDAPSSYYSTTAASYGLQAGGQRFAYILFFMNKDALDYFERTEGYEVGVGPGVTFFNVGVARNLTSTTLRDDIYACIFNAQGLMAGNGFQGTKVTNLEIG